MKGKDSSENKGYAFVTFRTKELAAKAIEDLNNIEFKVDPPLFILLHLFSILCFLDIFIGDVMFLL